MRKSSDKNRILVNKLTVEDARHLVQNEGETTGVGLLINLVSTICVWGLCARAIWRGDATVWHLVLPMVAEAVTMLIYLPILRFAMSAPQINKEAKQAVGWMVGLAFGIAIYVAVASFKQETSWRELVVRDLERVRQWVLGSYMGWPIVGASIGVLVSLPRRVYNVKKYGPPFVGVSLGCAARVLVFFSAAFLVPMVAEYHWSVVWVVWALIVIAELLAIWMQWDVQRRLKALDDGVK